MALVKCKECGEEVSTKAKTCPKCGAKAPTKQYRTAISF
ncbi:MULTISPECIES: zinc-ribbon domain-containing protein [Shewanella]